MLMPMVLNTDLILISSSSMGMIACRPNIRNRDHDQPDMSTSEYAAGRFSVFAKTPEKRFHDESLA